MTIDTIKLRELAQKATPGPWYSKWPEERCAWKDIGHSRYPVAYTGDCFDDAQNAEFIAAANPATVLALLDERDAMNETMRHMRAELEKLRPVKDAAENLAKVKGRHNSEIAMNRLLETLK